MPISEDEFDSRQNTVQANNVHNMTKAELRRSNKPIMEKKRRARINHCLNELKSLILDAMKKDPARHSKLEKADILEMTVRHLQSVQRRQQLSSAAVTSAVSQLHPAVTSAAATAVPTDALARFRGGFGECAQEVAKCASRLTGQDAEVARRLVAHLENCVTGLNQIAPPTNVAHGVFSTPGQNNAIIPPSSIPIATNPVSATSSVYLPEDINNNQNNPSRIQMGTMQLIPSRLPTGELALVLPHSSNLPFFPQKPFLNSGNTRNSAFTAVISSNNQQKILTPLLSPADTLSSTSNISDEDDGTSDLINKTPIRKFLSPQQAHVSSTTISPESLKTSGSFLYENPGVVLSNKVDFGSKVNSLSTSLWVESVQQNSNKKRLREAEDDCKEMKMPKVSSSNEEDDRRGEEGNERIEEQGSSGEMWRPW